MLCFFLKKNLIDNIYKILKLARFYKSYRRYVRLISRGELPTLSFYPCIDDNTGATPFDAHYFYQGIWALKKIKNSRTKSHIDVGSEIKWVGLLSTVTDMTFIDIRPFNAKLENLTIRSGDILNLPFGDNSVSSLSCLHVAEHIGLGRYGDKLDAKGTEKACKELMRVLKPGGNLYFSVPVGKEKTYFNAHRVHLSKTIIEYFRGLKLIELSGVTDSGEFIENIDMNILENSTYACGLFWFRKKEG